MVRKAIIPLVCLAVVLAFGLTACGNSSTSSSAATSSGSSPAASSTASSTSASSPAATKTFDAKYTNEKGGVTAIAVVELNGPDLVQLLEQQGYEFSDISHTWKRNGGTDQFSIRNAKNTKDSISLKDYEAATEPGALAKDSCVSIRSTDYDMSGLQTDPEGMYANVRESQMPGFEVENTKYLAFGGENWSIIKNAKDGRFLLEIGAYDETTCTVTLEDDGWAAADGMESIDKIFN